MVAKKQKHDIEWGNGYRTMNDKSDLKVIANDIKHISRDVEEIKTTLRGSYVSKDEFEPIKRIVYGLVSLILVTVVGGLMGLVILQ